MLGIFGFQFFRFRQIPARIFSHFLCKILLCLLIALPDKKNRQIKFSQNIIFPNGTVLQDLSFYTQITLLQMLLRLTTYTVIRCLLVIDKLKFGTALSWVKWALEAKLFTFTREYYAFYHQQVSHLDSRRCKCQIQH